VPALRRALAHDAPQVRLSAAWALGNIEDVAAVADLEALVARDADRRVRLAAIQAVGEIGQRRSLDVLLRVLEGRDLEMSVAAVEAIDDLGDLETAPPALVRAAESTHLPLQRAALVALFDIEDPALVPVFLPHITSDDAEIRQSVIEALGELKARDAIPAIRRALSDPVADVRRAAIEALAEINDRS
jgi:HEAT repeat protein